MGEALLRSVVNKKLGFIYGFGNSGEGVVEGFWGGSQLQGSTKRDTDITTFVDVVQAQFILIFYAMKAPNRYRG